MWNNLFQHKLPAILKEYSVDVGNYSLSYSFNGSDFLSTNFVDRNKMDINKVLSVDVNIKNKNPEVGQFSEISYENVNVAKLPILTDNGVVIKGTRHYYVNEISQADGWYFLKNEAKKVEEAVKYDTDDEVEEFSEENKINEEFLNSDEFTSDEMDNTDAENQIESLINNGDDKDTDEVELMSVNTALNDAEGCYLRYRGPFKKNLMFTHSTMKDGSKRFYVKFTNNGTHKVTWFQFLKAILPDLSVEEILAKFEGLPLMTEAYTSDRMIYAKSGGTFGKETKGPSINDSSEACARYVLQTFFVTKSNKHAYLSGVIDPIHELRKRLEYLKCDTENRNKDIFSLHNYVGYYLREPLKLSQETLNRISGLITVPNVGDVLSLTQLITLDKTELSEIVISKTEDSRAYKVLKPKQKDDFTEEIVDMFRQYLLLCEGIGEPQVEDMLKNKEIVTLESRIVNTVKKVLNKFNTNFADEVNTADYSKTPVKESVFSACFRVDINAEYKQLLKTIHSSSNYQGKDDTNSLSSFAQKYQLKYGVKNAPNSLRSIAEDQFGFICPQTTSEGGNVGLNIFRTTDTVIEDCILKKKFIKLSNGEIVGGEEPEIVALSAGEVSRSLIIKRTDELPDRNAIVTCYCGTKQVEVPLKNVEYMELSDYQNVSPNLGIIVGANNNGGKRGTMGPNQEKQSQGLLLSDSQMVDTGIFEHEDIGVVRGKEFIRKALLEVGADHLLDTVDKWTVKLLDTSQRDYASSVNYLIYTTGVDDPIVSQIMSKTFSYEIITLAPTLKKSLSHQKIRYVPDNQYDSEDIVVYSSDIDVNEYDTEGNNLDGKKTRKIALKSGKQLRIVFGVYEGFGYEDAIIINEQSVHSGQLAIMTYFTVTDEIKLDRKTKDEEVKRFARNNSDISCVHLNENGLPKLGTVLGVGDVVISREEKHGTEVSYSYSRLKEGSKDKGCVVAAGTEVYKKEDGFEYVKATVSLMYINDPALGTKFSGGHGNKGVISKIAPASMMPYDEDGNRADLILNPTGSLPRNNMGQFTEIISNSIGLKTNVVQMIKPFEKWNISELLAKAKDLDIVEKKLYDGITGMPFDRPVLIGRMTIFRSEHDVKGKFNSCSLSTNYNTTTLTVNRGPGGGQRIGEMYDWALLAKGTIKYLDSMFTVQGGDVRKREKWIKAVLSGDEPPVEEGDNRLNILAKVRFFLMGVVFSDYNNGQFEALTDELIEKSDFLITTNDTTIDSSNGKYGSSGRQRGEEIAKSQAFNYSRCIPLRKRMIYPIFAESAYLRQFMLYINPSGSESNGLRTSINSWLYKKDIAPIGDEVKCMSGALLKELMKVGSTKQIVFVRGVELPFLCTKKYWKEYLADIAELVNSNSIDKNAISIINNNVKIFTGYDTVASLLLGSKYSTESTYLEHCSDNRNILHSVIMHKLVGKVFGEKENKFAVDSYVFGDFYDNVIDFIKERQPDFEAIEFDKILKYIENDEYINVVDDGVNPVIISEFDALSSYLIDFNQLKYKGGSLSDELDRLTSLTNFDVFKSVSCSHLWIPPRAFRQDTITGAPCEMQKILKGISDGVAQVTEDAITSEFSTRLYNDLDRLKTMCITDLCDHKNRNAILRDQVMSVRISCSARGYITVDPTLGMDEAGIPIPHAAGVFSTFIQSPDEYPEQSMIGRLFSTLYDEENNKKNRNVYSSLITFLASGNKNSFLELARSSSGYRRLREDVIEKYSIEEELENIKNNRGDDVIFKECRQDLIAKLKSLLEVYKVTLERAPTFWAPSIQAFKGILKENCHSIALCPLNCRAFNADFDGDQMSMSIAIEESAREEQNEKMLPSKNIINASDGKIIQNLNQDMALGIYWLTIERRNAKSVDKLNEGIEIEYDDKGNALQVVRTEEVPVASYTSADAIERDIDLGLIAPHDYVIMRVDKEGESRFYKDTAGRLLFNSLIPENGGFTDKRRAIVKDKVQIVTKDSQNVDWLDSFYVLYTDTCNLKCIRGGDLQEIANWVAGNYGPEATALYLERAMRIGFKMAHKSGVTLSLYDFEDILNDDVIASQKQSVKDEIREAEEFMNLGLGTKEEYSNYLLTKFQKVNNDLAELLKERLDKYSNLFLLIDSGARGSFKQLVALTIMVGLPTDAKGNVIPQPIFGNYIEGLDSTEYFNTSYSTREALVTGSIHTGTIGEVLRTMVYQCEHNVIKEVEPRDYEDEPKYCEVEPVNIRLDYKIDLPSNFDSNISELVDLDEADNEWHNLMAEWTQICSERNMGSKEDLLKKLIPEYGVKEIHYRNGDNPNVFTNEVVYHLEDYYKNLVSKRSIDTGRIKLKNLQETGVGYSVATDETIRELEERAIRKIPVYLAMNCKCKDGICRRCFGVNDKWEVPEHFTNVGIQSAQSVGQKTSQIALDSHKSSGGSALSDFASFTKILRQQGVGKGVFVAEDNGMLEFKPDEENEYTKIFLVTKSERVSIGSLTKSGIRQMGYANGDYVYKGDLLYYDGTVNYGKMYEVMRDIHWNELEAVYNCKTNLLKVIVGIFDCELSIRHFDILLRDLTRFGQVEETKKSRDGDKVYVKGSVHDMNELMDAGVSFRPIAVSSLKSQQLNKKYASSISMSYLRAQLGNIAALKRKSMRTPLNCMLEGVALTDVFSEDRKTEDELHDKYYNRRYGTSINEKTEEVKKIFAKEANNEGTVMVSSTTLDKAAAVARIGKRQKGTMAKLKGLLKNQQNTAEVKEEVKEVVVQNETIDKKTAEEMRKFQEAKERRRAELERQENEKLEKEEQVKEKEEQVKKREDHKGKTLDAKTTHYFS